MSEGVEKEAILRSLERLRKTVCKICNKIRACTTKDRLCLKCKAQEEKSKMRYDALDLEVNELLESIQEANKTEINVMRHIPEEL